MSTDIRLDKIGPGNWHQQFSDIHMSIEVAERFLKEISDWVWHNVVAEDVLPKQMPSEISEILNNLNQELQKNKEKK